MKRLSIILLSLLFFLPLSSQGHKRSYVWLDCQSNYNRLSSPDSINYYPTKVKESQKEEEFADAVSVECEKSKLFSVKADDTRVQYMGRTLRNQDGSVSFNWSGVSISFDFLGSYCEMNISDTGTNYYDLYIDGKLEKVFPVSGDKKRVVLYRGVEGRHSLKLQKRTEVTLGTSTLHSFSFSAENAILPTESEVTRNIVFVGDSYTCGYGTESSSGEDPFLPETENCHKAFGVIIAKHFGADYTLISRSGIGVARNYGDKNSVSEKTMRHHVRERIYDDPSSRIDSREEREADIVVIYLGTNDFSTRPFPPKDKFQAAYSELVKEIRKVYGDVPILCVASNLSKECFDYINDFVEKSSKVEKIYVAPIFTNFINSKTDFGASLHPNYLGQQKIAMLLAPYIATITGWDLNFK